VELRPALDSIGKALLLRIYLALSEIEHADFIEHYGPLQDRLNIEGLKRRGFGADEIAALRRAYKLIYKSGLTLDEARAALKEARDEARALGREADTAEREARRARADAEKAERRVAEAEERLARLRR